MKKSIRQRIKITKSGKFLRKAMGQGHNRAKKRTVQLKRIKKTRGLFGGSKMTKKNL
jgi:ribosomal protein L35